MAKSISANIKGTSLVDCDRFYEKKVCHLKGEADLVIMDLVHLAGVVL